MADTKFSRKRRRNTTSGAEQPASAIEAPDKHEIFTEYAKSRGVFIGSVKPAALPGRGIGLVCTAPIERDERILFVPEKAMFKPDLPMLKKEGIESKISPQAQLTLSLVSALADDSSALHAWKATWPTPENIESSMPHFWDEALLKLLPPSMGQPLERQQADFKKDTEDRSSINFLARRHSIAQDWPYFWFIVNSRCFHFKPPGSRPGFMVLCPFIDYLNHGPTGSGCDVRQTPKGYEVHADRDYGIGEELLATYGSNSNEKLLIHYGFVCDSGSGPSVDDDVRLDHAILPKLDPGVKQQLQDVGFLGSYALVPATNEICFKTQVAIRAALLTANEWEYFITNGEDLSGDQSAKVDEWLRVPMIGYHKEAKEKLKQIEEQRATESHEALDLLCTRWTQIRDALETYLQTRSKY